MKTNTSRMLATVALIGMSLSVPTHAHHSVAAFDRANPATLTGTIKEMKWTNPHTWIYLMVPDGKGGQEQWDLEGGAVNMVVRQGWTKNTIQPGMKVKLLIAPRKDGQAGGEWLRLLEINGQVFQSPETAQ